MISPRTLAVVNRSSDLSRSSGVPDRPGLLFFAAVEELLHPGEDLDFFRLVGGHTISDEIFSSTLSGDASGAMIAHLGSLVAYDGPELSLENLIRLAVESDAAFIHALLSNAPVEPSTLITQVLAEAKKIDHSSRNDRSDAHKPRYEYALDIDWATHSESYKFTSLAHAQYAKTFLEQLARNETPARSSPIAFGVSIPAHISAAIAFTLRKIS